MFHINREKVASVVDTFTGCEQYKDDGDNDMEKKALGMKVIWRETSNHPVESEGNACQPTIWIRTARMS